MTPQSLRDTRADAAASKPGGPTGSDDPFPAWLAEWEAATAQAERLGEELADDDEGDEQLGEFIDRKVSPVQDICEA